MMPDTGERYFPTRVTIQVKDPQRVATLSVFLEHPVLGFRDRIPPGLPGLSLYGTNQGPQHIQVCLLKTTQGPGHKASG